MSSAGVSSPKPININTMKIQKILSLFCIAFIGLAVSASAGDGWMTDFEAAKVKAKAENKPMLLSFTGSDWCPPCMALKKNVFQKKEV